MSKLPPRVSQDFIKESILSSEKLQATLEAGKTTAYIKAGKKPMHKRICYIRSNKGNDLDLDQAVFIALHFGFMTGLLEWLKKEKGWVDGGYDEKSM